MWGGLKKIVFPSKADMTGVSAGILNHVVHLGMTLYVGPAQ